MSAWPGTSPSDVGAAPAEHTHAIAGVSGLQAALDDLQSQIDNGGNGDG